MQDLYEFVFGFWGIVEDMLYYFVRLPHVLFIAACMVIVGGFQLALFIARPSKKK